MIRIPVTEITSYSHNSTNSLRYLFYGTYKISDIRKGYVKYNQAHTNNNGIKHRNQLIIGVDCHISYDGASHDFQFYNHQKPNRKVQGVMITLSFSKKDFNFHNKEDVYRAALFGRHFIKKAFPNRIALIAAQFDNNNATPHIHCFISGFREDNLRAFTSNQKNIYKIRTIADNLTAQYNKQNPTTPITDMTKYSGHHNRTPTKQELAIIRPLTKALYEYLPTSQSKLRQACKKFNLKASFKRGRKRSCGKMNGRRRKRRGLVFKAPGSNGFIKSSQLKEFDLYCPGIELLNNSTNRKKLFKQNKKQLKKRSKDTERTIYKKMAPLLNDFSYTTMNELKDKAKSSGVKISTNKYKHHNDQIGHIIKYSLIDTPELTFSGRHFSKDFKQATSKKFQYSFVRDQLKQSQLDYHKEQLNQIYWNQKLGNIDELLKSSKASEERLEAMAPIAHIPRDASKSHAAMSSKSKTSDFYNGLPNITPILQNDAPNGQDALTQEIHCAPKLKSRVAIKQINAKQRIKETDNKYNILDEDKHRNHVFLNKLSNWFKHAFYDKLYGVDGKDIKRVLTTNFDKLWNKATNVIQKYYIKATKYIKLDKRKRNNVPIQHVKSLIDHNNNERFNLKNISDESWSNNDKRLSYSYPKQYKKLAKISSIHQKNYRNYKNKKRTIKRRDSIKKSHEYNGPSM